MRNLLLNKVFISCTLAHFGLSLGGFLLLNAAAVGAQDAGVADSGLGWLEIPVAYGLLQPIALWLMLALEIAWWTPAGLALSTALLAANSLIACGLIAWVGRRLV